MKYLILVHGNLILGMARQLLAQVDWPEREIVWVTDRQFKVPLNGQEEMDISAIELPPFRGKDAVNIPGFLRSNKHNLAQLDQLLGKLDHDFILVLPHTQNFKYHAMLTHPACRGFYLLEEGKLSYTRGIEWPTHLSHRLKASALSWLYQKYLGGRVPAFPLTFDSRHPKYQGAFATSELAFPGIGQVQRIPTPFQADPALRHFEKVLVFGPYVEYDELPLVTQVLGIRALFRYLVEQGIGQIHFKFHPAQLARGESPLLIRKAMEDFAEQIQFEEIPPEISLENIAASSKADFYLATSSTAIYAVAMGRPVYSYAPYYIRLQPDFQQVLDDLPAVIREKMHWLELS